MKRRSRWLALLAGIGLVFAMTSSVFAYHGQVPTTIVVTPSKGTFKCDQWYTVRATVLDQNANPIKGLKIKWSIDPSVSSHDKIDPKTSKTNRHGVAKTRVKLSCKKPDDRFIKATADGISISAVVHVKLRHHGDDDDHDGDHDGDHDDDHDDDHDGDHGGDGHHEDGVNKSVGSATVFVALTDATAAGTSATAAGTSATSGQAFGAVMAFTAESLPSTATIPADASTDGLAIPAMLAVLAGLAIILRRFALSRR